MATPALDQDEWWHYGVKHGLHIGFYRAKILERLARERGRD